MKRTIALILTMLLLGSLLAGCAQPAPAASEPQAAAEAAQPATSEAAAPAEAAAPTEAPVETSVVRGGTLIAAKTTKCSNLNPCKTSARADDRYIIGQIYEPLIGIDESGNFVPQLATSWKMDDTAVTLTLRDDVVFHDGTKFNAEAVKSVLEWYLSEECAHVYRSEIAEISSIDVVDEYTVCLNLSAPSAAILGALANVAGYMISPAAIQQYGEDLSLYTCGTGPFVLKEAIEGDHVTLVRNENYYLMGEDGKPLPYLDEVVIKIVGDDSVKTTNLMTGDVQLVDWNNSVTSTISLQADGSITTVKTPATDIYTLLINTSDPQLADVRVRQAIAYGINREEVVAAMTEGLGSPAVFLASPNQWFYDDYTPYSFNPEKAKSLLAEAGFAGGIEIHLRYISREPDNTIAQLLKAQLKDIGVNLEIEAMERLAWVEMHSTNQGGELGFAKFNIPRVDPYQQYKQFTGYITKNAATYEEYGAGLIELLDKSKSTYDIEERKALLKELQQKTLDNCEDVYVYTMSRYTSWNNEVKGILLETDGTWNLKATYLSK